MRKIKGRHRHIDFNGMTLVPVEDSNNLWHVPGRTVMSTQALVDRANKLGVPITMTTVSRKGVRTSILN